MDDTVIIPIIIKSRVTFALERVGIGSDSNIVGRCRGSLVSGIFLPFHGPRGVLGGELKHEWFSGSRCSTQKFPLQKEH
jgi:hypothetical protein